MVIEFDGIIPLDRRHNLPQCSGIYFLLDQDNIVYVGKSKNIRHRWRSHHRFTEAAELSAPRIAWMVADESVLSDREDEFIKKLSPKLNNLMSVPPNRWGNVRITVTIPKSMHKWLMSKDMPAAEYLRRLIQADMEA